MTHDQNHRDEPGTRPAKPGETCTCGAPAKVVYETARFGDVGYCGVSHGGEQHPPGIKPDPMAVSVTLPAGFMNVVAEARELLASVDLLGLGERLRREVLPVLDACPDGLYEYVSDISGYDELHTALVTGVSALLDGLRLGAGDLQRSEFLTVEEGDERYLREGRSNELAAGIPVSWALPDGHTDRDFAEAITTRARATIGALERDMPRVTSILIGAEAEALAAAERRRDLGGTAQERSAAYGAARRPHTADLFDALAMLHELTDVDAIVAPAFEDGRRKTAGEAA